MANNKLEENVDNFYNYLIKYKKDYLTMFSDLQIQIEGWFRGELMLFIKQHNFSMKPVNREKKVSKDERRKVDLKT